MLRATTSGGTGFGIRYPPSGSLDLPLRDVSVWIKDTDTFYFFVQVHATDGNNYYIRYEPSSGSPYPSGSYAIVPVGTQYRDGTWRELRRDLDADLRAVFGVGVEYVKWFCIRGNYDLDELTLIGREERSYYYAGGQRVAMRRDGVVYYLHTDHLGSTSLATDSGGGEVLDSRTLYYPYGQVRWPTGGSTLPTDYTFTGQRDEAGLGLMDYHARFYDPYLGRFISADTVVPNPGNPQDLNRYSYVRNNPLAYVDPSGHIVQPPPSPGPYAEYDITDWPDPYRSAAELMCGMAPNCRIREDGYWEQVAVPNCHTGGNVERQVWRGTSVRVIWNDRNQWVNYQINSLAGIGADFIIAPSLVPSGIDWAADAVWAEQRAQELQQQVGKAHGFGTTMAAATAYDEGGAQHLLIGSSEGSYLRKGVVFQSGEEFVGGIRGIHAEQNIVNYANANNLQVAYVEATLKTGICPQCEFYIVEAGGVPGLTQSGNAYLSTILRSE